MRIEAFDLDFWNNRMSDRVNVFDDAKMSCLNILGAPIATKRQGL